MRIGSFQKTSLVDFPGTVASAVFVAGCNFRCGFCHNPDLVLGSPSSVDLSVEGVISELEARKGFIDGVCVSGGEPTVFSDLPEFLAKIKSLGLKVKLDTNGSNPDMLEDIIGKGLVDYVAMDIKSSLWSYPSVVNAQVDTNKILKSISLLLRSGIDYEFRTTVVPRLFGMEELKSICKEISGSKRYVLQQFSNSNEMISKEFGSVKPFARGQLEEFRVFAEKFVQECYVRGT